MFTRTLIVPVMALTAAFSIARAQDDSTPPVPPTPTAPVPPQAVPSAVQVAPSMLAKTCVCTTWAHRRLDAEARWREIAGRREDRDRRLEAIDKELKGEVSLDRLLAMGDELRDIRAGTLEDRVLFARLVAGDRAIAAEQKAHDAKYGTSTRHPGLTMAVPRAVPAGK